MAIDAAKAGEVGIVMKAASQILELQTRDETRREACRLLAKRGMRRQAIEIAKSMIDSTIRSQTLSELAE